MKKSNIFAACILLLTSSILSTPAMADKATVMRATGKVPDHVTCPSNTDASFSGGVRAPCPGAGTAAGARAPDREASAR